MSKLDTKFRDIGRELGVRFGEEELSYDFLSHSADYFTKVCGRYSAQKLKIDSLITSNSVSLTTQPFLRSYVKKYVPYPLIPHRGYRMILCYMGYTIQLGLGGFCSKFALLCYVPMLRKISIMPGKLSIMLIPRSIMLIMLLN